MVSMVSFLKWFILSLTICFHVHSLASLSYYFYHHAHYHCRLHHHYLYNFLCIYLFVYLFILSWCFLFTITWTSHQFSTCYFFIFRRNSNCIPFCVFFSSVDYEYSIKIHFLDFFCPLIVSFSIFFSPWSAPELWPFPVLLSVLKYLQQLFLHILPKKLIKFFEIGNFLGSGERKRFVHHPHFSILLAMQSHLK